MSNFDRIGTPASAEYATVHVVFELSKAKWKLGVLLPDSQPLHDCWRRLEGVGGALGRCANEG
jgi:hypothetical protein